MAKARKRAKKGSKRAKGKKPSKADVAAAFRILNANRGNTKAKKAAKRAGKGGGPRKGRKLSASAKAKISKATKARWRARKGAGKPGKGKHIPLRVLKTNHQNLGKLIALREKSPASWS